MLARLHWGGGPVPVEHAWLHAHLQIVGFFGTLIVGVPTTSSRASPDDRWP